MTDIRELEIKNIMEFLRKNLFTHYDNMGTNLFKLGFERLRGMIDVERFMAFERAGLVEKEFPNKRGKEGETEKVMVYTNVDLVMELLPPQEGFFFGGTYVDEYYLEDLKNTIEQLQDLDEKCDYYYQSSW